MLRLNAPVLLSVVLLLAGPGSAQVADPVPDIAVGNRAVAVEVVATLPDSGPAHRPTARPMTLIGDGTGRRFVVDQNGPIFQLHPDGSLSLFLDVAAATPMLSNQRQIGLSSLAFHPDFDVPGAAGEGRIFTTSSQPADVTPDFPVPVGAPVSHHSVLHEWTLDATDPNQVDPASRREVLRVAEPYHDHNMGQIGFDPNVAPTDPDHGLLYIAQGDGGNFGCCPRPTVDPHFVGQDLGSPLGTMLRIDPLALGGSPYGVPLSNAFEADGDPSTLGEIWAHGLRNPHRFTFDTGGTGRLFISDIGQSNIEEIVIGANGANFGWSEREGTFLVVHDNEVDVFPLPPNDATLGFTYPVVQYDHDEGDNAVSGGSVYRGSAVPALIDRYVFGDLASGRLFIADIDDLDGSGLAPFETLRLLDAATGEERTLLEMIGVARADLRFGQDDAGEVYLVTKQDGAVRRLVAAAECNDGLDNDGDGFTDAAADPGCHLPSSLREAPQCQDGLDNDGQPGTDFDGGVSAGATADPNGADPQCTAGWKKLEAAQSSCGLGPELIALLPALAFARIRRSARGQA